MSKNFWHPWNSHCCCQDTAKQCLRRCRNIANAEGTMQIAGSTAALPNTVDTGDISLQWPDSFNGLPWSNTMSEGHDFGATTISDWSVVSGNATLDERIGLTGMVSIPTCVDGVPVESVDVILETGTAWESIDGWIGPDPSSTVKFSELARFGAGQTDPVSVEGECFYLHVLLFDDGATGEMQAKWSINGGPYEVIPLAATSRDQCSADQLVYDYHCINADGTIIMPDATYGVQADLDALGDTLIPFPCADMPECEIKDFDLEWSAGTDPDCQSWEVSETRDNGSVVPVIDTTITAVSEELGPNGEVTVAVTYPDGCTKTKTFRNTVSTDADLWTGSASTIQDSDLNVGDPMSIPLTSGSHVTGNTGAGGGNWDLFIHSNGLYRSRYGTVADPTRTYFDAGMDAAGNPIPIPLQNAPCASSVTVTSQHMEAHAMLASDSFENSVIWFDAAGNEISTVITETVTGNYTNITLTETVPKPPGATSFLFCSAGQTESATGTPTTREHRIMMTGSSITQS